MALLAIGPTVFKVLDTLTAMNVIGLPLSQPVQQRLNSTHETADDASKTTKTLNQHQSQQSSKQSTNRQLSSIPVGLQKGLPPGTILQFKRTKFDRKTGEYSYNHTDTLKIKRNQKQKMFALFKSGKTWQWSSRQLSYNAFLPPLLWFKSKTFRFEVRPQGDFNALYPVQLHQSARFQVKTLSSQERPMTTEKNCEVTQTLQRTIAQETMDLFVVKCETSMDAGTGQETHWYSPKYNLVVHSNIVEKLGAREFEEVLDLQSLQFPKSHSQ
jgi:hypothetical protein